MRKGSHEVIWRRGCDTQLMCSLFLFFLSKTSNMFCILSDRKEQEAGWRKKDASHWCANPVRVGFSGSRISSRQMLHSDKFWFTLIIQMHDWCNKKRKRWRVTKKGSFSSPSLVHRMELQQEFQSLDPVVVSNGCERICEPVLLFSLSNLRMHDEFATLSLREILFYFFALFLSPCLTPLHF